MNTHIFLLLLLIAAAMFFFSLESVSADVVALGLLVLLVFTRLIPVEQAFLGFGSDTVIMILGLLILTAALRRTGVIELAGRAIMRRTGQNPDRLLLVIMIASAVLGAFMSNTASTAFFLPIAVGMAQRARISPSKLLMPLAFASILTSSVTLISTSTNIVISGLLTKYQMQPMGMFELAPVGVPVAVVGLAYMLLIGRRLIPERAASDELTDSFGLRPYLTEVMILPKSALIGKTLVEAGLGRDLDLTVLRVVREKSRYLVPVGDLLIEQDDVLLVEGMRDQILKVKDMAGIDIKADVKLSDPDLDVEDLNLVEVILLPRSSLIGRTLKGHRFRERYGLQVLAINRRSGTITRKISQVPLRMGDLLLIQGPREKIRLLAEDRTFQILGAVEEKRPNLSRAPIAIAIFAGVMLAATFNLLSLPVATLTGAVLAFLTRCITPEEAYREVEWKALILIGSMLAVGVALEETGTASFLAAQIVGFAGRSNPVWLLSAFFGLAVLLTQPMSNQASAIVLVPVALQTAQQLGMNPRTFAMMIAVAASCSYLTPLEPSCLMVYGLGRYRFMDFLKVGSLLTVLIYLLSILLVPMVWPLYP